MTVVLYFCQFLGLFIHCFSLSNTQKQWLSSSPPEMDTLQRFNNIPWLVSIDETCQGIILNHWWILSTVNCLTKLKYLTSDISKVINKEGILHGDKICLHPSINPRDGKYTVKEIIGVIRLQFPIRGKEISLSQSYNIFRRTCFNCLYKQCRVYQYQKYSTFENNIKKLSVKFLDISFCHDQHNHMPKSNKLCIWIHQKEDCLIQQGSPVLCIFGSHWEVVGLVSESSMTCDSPILVIKTAPYLSWMRWFIKTDQKPLDPIFPLLCNFYPGIEDGLNNSISNTVFASSGFSFESWSRLTTSSQSRLRRNPPPFFFVSSNKDSFASSQHYFQDGHIFSASKFSTSRPRTTPMFKTLETLLREEPMLMPPSQPGLQDRHSMEPLSFRQSKLNVSLPECHLSMIWKDNLQALWLYKTAVVSHKTTECGLRPGLVPHCPNCWEAEIGEFPWIVSVQLSYSHFCAGSILNEKWILTSARCANFVKRSEALALVQVGLVDLQDPTQGEIVGIHRSMPYLGPSGPLGPGLILLKEPLRFQPLVLPICLEESQEQDRQIQLYDCWLPSWSLMRGSPGILQKRHLSIMQVSTCAKFWPQLNEFTFCVEAKKAMGESGCKGDLGAPLVCHLQHKDTWVQMGILIHFDENCKKPYVFSHVSPFIFWLQRVTQPSHGPWSNQRPVTISSSNSLSVFTKRKVSTFTSSNDSIHPHYITLSQPQALADHISLQYTMPWQALIFSCGNQICSGSIISSYWILTSAHCVRRMNPKDTVVILGFRNPGTPLRVVKVTTILLHEQFRLLNQASRNDLALVLLQEGQSSIHIVAPLGNIKNLNTSECWLSGPQILTQGDILENPEMLQIQVMGGSNCAYLYPDIGGSTVCYTAQARGPEINMESVSPGSTVMCRPISGNGKWRQIGFTSLKHLATIVSPHFSWILSSTAKAGYPLNPTLTPWVQNPKSSSLVRQPTTLLLYFGMANAVTRIFIL